ncbi:tRNA pseudouridine synthase [Phellopilus nigrolimitatus]|nr:tRNA pseudouridine synthase [Phellopilus nigrolimitatus]
MSPSYESWSREDLIARLNLLDSILPASRAHSSPRPRPRRKITKSFDISSYPRRKIALKFCYAGWEYNGLAFQTDKTPLPTVEETLYNALASCRLIDGAAGPQACGWERCGRTDRGVSSAGQVVSLWVRSNLGQADSVPGTSLAPSTSALVGTAPEITDSDFLLDAESELPLLELSDTEEPHSTLSAPPSVEREQELRYVSILNRILPPTIRILAWSPIDPSFSSRFNCKNRHYKYFFSPDGLDLEAMRDAAQRLIGEHDFRNLCKIDPSKQIASYKRRILRAEINMTSVFADDDPAPPSARMCVFDLAGNAFLYNQVRHIMAVLLLVGAGLESSTVVSALLNANPTDPEPPFREGEPAPEFVTCKPEYQMADPLPLVLWECTYGADDVAWQTDDQEREDGGEAMSVGAKSLYRQMNAIHVRSLIHSVLDAHFLRAVSAFHPSPSTSFSLNASTTSDFSRSNPSTVLNIPLGGGMTRRTAARYYIPLLLRKRLEHVDVVNNRWRQKGKIERRAEKNADTLVLVNANE